MNGIGGTFVIDGNALPWLRNPSAGGWMLDLGMETIQIAGEPSESSARVAFAAYQQGVAHGKTIGRSTLQNDFSNLMGLQR